MNLISIRKKRRPAIALLLCTGLLGACPPDAVADAGDRLPVPEIQQSKSPVKRTLVGTVTDASTGETLIGVKPIRVHDIRHSHVAYLIYQGVEPLIIKERLGHKDIQMTLNTYGHLYPSQQKKVAEMLDNKR